MVAVVLRHTSSRPQALSGMPVDEIGGTGAPTDELDLRAAPGCSFIARLVAPIERFQRHTPPIMAVRRLLFDLVYAGACVVALPSGARVAMTCDHFLYLQSIIVGLIQAFSVGA